MINRQALMVRYLEPTLEAVIQYVIKIENFSKKHALNTRLFHELSQDGEAEYTDLLNQTEVRWTLKTAITSRIQS